MPSNSCMKRMLVSVWTFSMNVNYSSILMTFHDMRVSLPCDYRGKYKQAGIALHLFWPSKRLGVGAGDISIEVNIF